ncbi:MAG: hypothetical protein JWN40_3886 [Phycisphaerales bacterium]|nr:hypothetical protein [Phycisphaerales bacterium]
MNEPEHDPGAPDSAARRITSVDLAAAIDQFSDVGLLTEGKINLIALDAIVERLADRWAMRRAQIHDYVDRFIQRRLGPEGYHLRISETDFLICQPDLGRFAGQAACLQILREVLTYFIGDATQADHCVHQVTKVSATEIQGARVRASEEEQGERMPSAIDPISESHYRFKPHSWTRMTSRGIATSLAGSERWSASRSKRLLRRFPAGSSSVPRATSW